MLEKYRAIVIGTSAGGVDALSQIIRSLPKTLSIPLFIVLHQPDNNKSGAVDLFQQMTSLKVREAEDKEPILAGHIYFAPPGYHLLMDSFHSLALSTEPPVNFSRPSIDVLFESASDVYGEDLIGIILTGANGDGALGLKRIEERGGLTWIQSPETARYPTMPLAAKTTVKSAQCYSLHDLQKLLAGLSPSKNVESHDGGTTCRK